MLGHILEGLAAGGKGAMDAYTWQKEHEQRDRVSETRAEIARLHAETRAMLEQLKEGGRAERHATPSGSVIAQQAGATERAGVANETRAAIAEMNADVQRANEGGRNTRFDKGITARSLWERMQDLTQRRGQDLRHDEAGARNVTTRRGQDLNAAAAAARDATARSGQTAATERARLRSGSGSRGSSWPLLGYETRDVTSRNDDDIELGSDPLNRAPAAEPLESRPFNVEPVELRSPVQPQQSFDAETAVHELRALISDVRNASTANEREAAMRRLREARARVPSRQ
jgi:hypothetical protein